MGRRMFGFQFRKSIELHNISDVEMATMYVSGLDSLMTKLVN